MPSSQGLEFVETIEPTLENATAIQRLTLQDATLGGFKNPTELADPSNPDMVAAQQQRLRDYPERYCGYVRDGKLIAYMKQNDWMIGDELPFTTGVQAARLKARRALHLDPSTGEWGIFGLVASDELEERDRETVLIGLLQRSFSDPRSWETRTVNIVIHENDPVLRIARYHGFGPVGELGEAAGAPGLIQRRYQRPALN
jgi:hypothetical protein